MEGRISANFYNQWSAASLWPGAAIVRHGKDLYKAEGPVNAAEPGNTSHMRYYALFGDPSLLVCALLMVQASLVTFQLLVIAKSQFWYHLMSQVSFPPAPPPGQKIIQSLSGNSGVRKLLHVIQAHEGLFNSQQNL